MPHALIADAMVWVQSSEMDRTAAYVQRGRAHSALSDADLFDRWKLAVIDLASDWTIEEKRARESDLKSEIDLRGQVPPWEAVEDAMQNLTARFTQAVAKLSLENPAELARCDEQIMRAVDDFKATKQSSGN